MDVAAHLDALAREGEALAVAASAAGPDAPVPGCPGWTVADLVGHTAEVLWFWTDVVEHRWDDPSPYRPPTRPAGGPPLVDWCRGAVERAGSVLGAADPTTPVWTWATPGNRATAAWAARRLAHEVAVHRWDAQSAAGGPSPIDARLASDGIDELLEVFSGTGPLGGTAHIHCTDVDGEWLVTDDGFTREHAKGAVALRGPASDLLLALWRRRPLDGLDVLGDEAVADRLVARAKLDSS